ncbi:MAG TPA: YIP1 family protein [Pyrinomonadaceae bacterium]|nr:YIP1 family protein [Pyrinomonadaceae bacterium]
MSDANAEFQPPPPPTAQPTTPARERPVRLRMPAIILFVLGVLLAVLAAIKIVPISIGVGASFCFFGVLLFALSFIPLPDVPPSGEERMGLGQMLGSIFYEPARVFRSLRAHPRWLAPFLIISVVTGVYAAAFVQRLTPERLINYTMDKVVEAGFAPAEVIDQQRQEEIQKAKNPVNRVASALQQFVGVFALTCFVAGLYLLVITIFGGRINFWQSLAVVFWASLPVVVISKLLSLIILFVKDPADLHPILGQETLVQDNLGILFSPAQNPILFVAASAIGALSFYGLWLRAKGLHNGGTKVSSTAGWGAAVTVWLLTVVLGLILAALFPGFMS